MDSLPEVVVRHLRQLGLITTDQVEDARKLVSELAQKDKRVTITEALVLLNILTEDQVANIEKRVQAQQQGGLRQLGNFKILKKLGEGGMGAVYLAEDLANGAKVALKVLPKKYSADEQLVSRFRREAKSAGRLDHANIVKALTVGEDMGCHYYVMEYCDGIPLDRVLKRDGVLPWESAIGIVIMVARGLHHAHDLGLVHRDIKPSNIFMAASPGSSPASGNAYGVAKILDMGLSKDISGAEQSFNTQTGVALGTPHYIAPEQARGDKDVDGRADIYALGATLYHLVTGQTPFQGPTPAIIMMMHLNNELPNPQDLRDDIPDDVAQVIRKMMMKEPRDRYATCADLLKDLELVLAGKSPRGAAIEAGNSSVALPRARKGSAHAAGRARTDKRKISERRVSPIAPWRFALVGVVSVALATLLYALIDKPARGSIQNSKASESATGSPAPSEKITPVSTATSVPIPDKVVAGKVDPGKVFKPGLAAEYYERPGLERSKLILRRIDPNINFNSVNGPPAPGLPKDRFAARWMGYLEVAQDGQYKFSAEHDNGMRLWVDGKSLVNQWNLETYRSETEYLFLKAGHHSLCVEFFDTGGECFFKLMWSQKNGFSNQILPPERLFHTPDQAAPVMGTLEAVAAKLKELNPDYDGKYGYSMEAGVPLEFSVQTDGITDLSPVRALVKLEKLVCRGSGDGKGKLMDLKPLQGLMLKSLDCGNNLVSDLGPLKGMPLQTLTITANQITDLSALKGMPLQDLGCDVPSHPFAASDVETLVGLTKLMTFNKRDAVSQMKVLRDYSQRFARIPANQRPGLSGTIFKDKDFKIRSGESVFGWLGWNWGIGRPSLGVDADNFSIRWSGYVTAPKPGRYQLRAEVHDQALIRLDGREVLKITTIGDSSVNLELTGKPQALEIDYIERLNAALFYLYWTPEGGTEEVIPPEAFSHDPVR